VINNGKWLCGSVLQKTATNSLNGEEWKQNEFKKCPQINNF
jgi:hypothetical protein